MAEVMQGGFFEGESTDLFERRVTQMLSNGHVIIGVAILQHTLGDGRGSMFTVCENAYLLRPLDEHFVKLMPGTARQRDDTHIVIGINHHLCLRHLPPDGIGKAEEQRIATGENDDGLRFEI